MIGTVESRRASYNNASAVSRSPLATRAKLLYYRAFAAAYAVAGGFADAVMANGSWTCGHLQQLWALPSPSSNAPVTGDATAAEGDGAVAAADALSGAAAGSGADAHLDTDDLPSTGPVSGADTDGSGGGSGSVGMLRMLSVPSLPSDERAAAATALAEASYRPVLGVLPSVARAFGLWSSHPAYRRPAARVVFPPCNTELLAALPLGWHYTSREEAAAAATAGAGKSVEQASAAATSRVDEGDGGGRSTATATDDDVDADVDDVRAEGESASASAAGAAAAAAPSSSSTSAAGATAPAAARASVATLAPRFSTSRSRLVVSVAQFRPEKDHALQIRAFANFKRRGASSRPRLRPRSRPRRTLDRHADKP